MIRDFLVAGLVDYMHTVVVPILLGRGVRLRDGLEGLEKDYDITGFDDFGDLRAGRDDYTVGQAVEDWLAYGLAKQGASTAVKLRSLCARNVLPLLGSRKLGKLTAGEVNASFGGPRPRAEHEQPAQRVRMSEPGGTSGGDPGSGAPAHSRAG